MWIKPLVTHCENFVGIWDFGQNQYDNLVVWAETYHQHDYFISTQPSLIYNPLLYDPLLFHYDIYLWHLFTQPPLIYDPSLYDQLLFLYDINLWNIFTQPSLISDPLLYHPLVFLYDIYLWNIFILLLQTLFSYITVFIVTKKFICFIHY